MNKKILTIDDLIMFCENQNFNTFNSKESGYQICVSLPATFEKAEDVNDDSMFYGNIKLLHSGRNRNHSNVTEEAAKKCMNTIAYKPILANFTDVNGDLDFTSHDFDINEDGSITYFEKQVGCFTADKPYMKQDPEHEDRKFVYAKCAIPRQYTAAADIIERKGGTKVSAELAVNDMSYSVDEGLLLNDVEVLGCTLLGVDPDTGQQILEGMESAYLQIEDFSAENNSVIFNKSELIDEITQAVINKLDNHTAFAEDNTTERRDDVAMDNENIKDVEFEETEVNEAKVEATEEEEKVPTDETAETPEVVDKFADDDPEDGSGDPDGDDTEEGNGDPDGEPNTESTTSNTEGGTEPGAGSTTEPTTPTTEPNTEPGAGGGTGSNTGGGTEPGTGSNPGANTESGTGSNPGSGAGGGTGSNTPGAGSNTGSNTPNTGSEGQSVSAIEDEDSTGTVKIKNSLNNSTDNKREFNINGMNFEVSMSEIMYSLYELVNNCYGETDNDYYSVEVYEGSKTVVMTGMFSGRSYRQGYKVRNNVYNLVGERTPVKVVYVTPDEEAELDRMRSNYSAIETELNSYKYKELHSLREEVLASEDYTVLKNDKDFKDLKENMDNYSVEELTNKADLIFAKFMKSHKNFSAAVTNNTVRTVFMNTNEGNTSEEKLPYGGLFKNFKSKR